MADLAPLISLGHGGRRRSLRRCRAEQGFSLVEVVIAFTILGVGLLAVAGAQVKAIRGGQNGRHLTQAAVLAQNQIEQLNGSRWTTLVPAGWTLLPPVTTQVVTGAGAATEQTYLVSWRSLDLVLGETRALDIRVNWTEPNGRNRSVATSTVRFNRENL